MNPFENRVAPVACLVAAVLLVVPAQSQACSCLDWIWPWNWGRGAASSTTYAPPYSPATSYAAPAITSSSCTSQVCSYVPQTCYRTVYSTVPVTVCQPVTACDPCSGCPVTTYRPVTTLTRQARLVPYTTYRMVWSNVTSSPCVSCGPSSGVSYSSATAASSACTSCAPSPPATSTPYYNGAPGGASATTTPSLSTPAPSETPPQQTTPPKTFEQKPTAEPESRLKPVPDTESESSNLPQLIGPESRTTALPIRQAALHRTISFSSTSPAVSNSVGGWRASRD